MTLLSDTINVWWNELKQMFSDLGVIIFIIGLPLGYPLLYYYVYSTEVARDVPVAVVDESLSALSRDFIRRLDASPEAAVVAHCSDLSQAQDLMARGEVYGVIRVPSSFSKDLQQGRQTRIGAYTDVSSMIYYKSILLPCSNISLDMNKEIKVVDMAQQMTDREVEIAKAPIDYRHVQLYNPQGGYASFLMPPILMLILQQAMILGVGMAMGRMREKNKGLAAYVGQPGYDNPLAIILGKILAIFPIFVLMAVYMYVAVTCGFRLPNLLHYWDWMAFILPYMLACTCFSIVCSFMIYRREDSMLLFVFMSVPLLFMSGVSWPSTAISGVWKFVSWFFPSTFGLNAHLKLCSLGASLHSVSFELTCIWIQVVCYFTLACLLQRFQKSHAKMFMRPSPALERMRPAADAKASDDEDASLSNGPEVR